MFFSLQTAVENELVRNPEFKIQNCKTIYLESAKLRALRAKKLLTSQRACRAYMLISQRALCTHVLMCQRVLPAYVFTCQRALYLRASRVNMPSMLLSTHVSKCTAS